MIATAISHQPIGKLLGDRELFRPAICWRLCRRRSDRLMPPAVSPSTTGPRPISGVGAPIRVAPAGADPGGCSCPMGHHCLTSSARWRWRSSRTARCVARRPWLSTRMALASPLAPYPRDIGAIPMASSSGLVNLLVDIREGRGNEAACHRRLPARMLRKEIERRASNLLMAILPIAGMVRDDMAVPHRSSTGRARGAGAPAHGRDRAGNGPTRSHRSASGQGPTASPAD